MLADKIDCYQAAKRKLYNMPAMYKDFYTFWNNCRDKNKNCFFPA
jgi:hypothetical protein